MSGGLMSGGRMSGGRLSGGLKSYDHRPCLTLFRIVELPFDGRFFIARWWRRRMGWIVVF